MTGVKAVKTSDSLAETTVTVRTSTAVSADPGGVGRLLASGETATVTQELSIRMTFGVDGNGSWRPGELTAMPKPLPIVDSDGAEAHVSETVPALFNWTLPRDDRYNTTIRGLFATAPNAEGKDYEGDQAPQSPPEIGGDETTTLGGLDQQNEVPDAGQPDLLDDLLPASNGTDVPSDGCVLNLSRLQTDGPEPPLESEAPGRPEDRNSSDGLTETLIATGTVNVTASGYECGSAGPSATNALNFRVDATRVRADGAAEDDRRRARDGQRGAHRRWRVRGARALHSEPRPGRVSPRCSSTKTDDDGAVVTRAPAGQPSHGGPGGWGYRLRPGCSLRSPPATCSGPLTRPLYAAYVVLFAVIVITAEPAYARLRGEAMIPTDQD